MYKQKSERERESHHMAQTVVRFMFRSSGREREKLCRRLWAFRDKAMEDYRWHSELASRAHRMMEVVDGALLALPPQNGRHRRGERARKAKT
ncbi:MAG: hypothetical protein L0Y56_02980 [Nitrospira sp.]|nr:hypothetical protein [Nitrospira sp.]